LPALTEQKFNNQRDVVLNERRQNYENRPYGLAGVAMSAAMFAPDHPYHWPTIGSAEDVRAARLDDVRAFFQAYYHPANASLSLAGDIETDQAFDLAEKYFGGLPAGPAVDRVRVEARLEESANLVLEDRVELPRLYINWHSPAMFAEDDAELDIVADVLAHGKTSRLYKTLVYERRIATDVSAYQHSREMGGMFQVACTASAGITLAELNSAILGAIVELANGGPTAAEMDRGVAQTEAQFIYRLQTIGGKGDQLNAYNTFAGNPGYFDADRQRYFDVTRGGAAAAVTRWLVNAPSVSLSVVPKDRRDIALAGAIEVRVS
jgi:zinc protease